MIKTSYCNHEGVSGMGICIMYKFIWIGGHDKDIILQSRGCIRDGDLYNV